MNADFLGQGWDPDNLRAGVAPNPAIVTSAGEKNVEQAIWIILATAPGERVMRPDFGCGIHHLVFEVHNSTTINNVAQAVKQALIRWEPRIEVRSVDCQLRHLGELLLINIHYRVRSTNNYFNFVYPFYTMGRPR